MARRRHADMPMLAAGVALASATMVPRMLVEVAAVNRSMVGPLLLPLGVLAAIPILAALWIARRREGEGPPSHEVALRNPFELGAALGWAVLLTGLALAVGAARALLGEPGVYAVAGLAGLADVDAIGISLARAAQGDLAASVAGRAIVLAALVNTLSKAGLAALVGGGRFGVRTVAILGAAAAAAGAVVAASVLRG
jgi:uncharacterized membrane protein (DUF4010 family)